MIGTLLLIVCITATVIIAPCRKKKKLGKKQSIHNGVTSIETSIQLPDVDKRQQCTCNTSEQSNHNHTKLKLHILASPNSLHNGKRSAQTRKKPTETGKKSVQTDSDSTQHGAATLRDVHVYDEVADSTDNVIELILTHPNDCDRVAKTSK